MEYCGPLKDVEVQCEHILRSLPQWFGDEASLLEYVADSNKYETFGALDRGKLIAFLTARKHFERSYEVHCIAVHANFRNIGIGKALHSYVESWLSERRVKFLQVKTLSSSHPSTAYAETRKFYEQIGYSPLEEFPTLWAQHLPVLQLIKYISSVG